MTYLPIFILIVASAGLLLLHDWLTRRRMREDREHDEFGILLRHKLYQESGAEWQRLQIETAKRLREELKGDDESWK